MLYEQLESIDQRPEPFSAYTAEDLWADPHISQRMLALHLNGDVALASRTASFIERSLQWLTELASLENGPGSRVLDLGCGPGLYSNRFAQTGAEVVGVDFSERSIEHAAGAADPSTSTAYVLGNYLDVDIDWTFDLVLLAMWDFGALSPSQRRKLLERVRAWLRPGGRFVFDVYGLKSLADREEAVVYSPNLMDGFWSSERYYGFHRTFIYEDEALLLDRYDIIEATRSRTIYNWLQYFDIASITAELEATGLAIESVHGDLTGAEIVSDPREFCVVAVAHSATNVPVG